MSSTIYAWGTDVKVVAYFYDENGVAADPTGVSFTALGPDMTPTSYVYGTDAEVTKDSTGVYRLTVNLTEPGTWRFRAVGSGTVVVAIESQPIPVAESPFYVEGV